jgi:hypothetical protein
MDLCKLYEPVHALTDYRNCYAAIMLHVPPGESLSAVVLHTALKSVPILLVEERYAKLNRENGNWSDILENPEKVERINLIAQLVNANSTNVTLFKQAANEVARLLYGKNHKLPYEDADFSPDLLEVPPMSRIDYYILAMNNLHLLYPTEDDPEIPYSRKMITHGFEFMTGATTVRKDESHLTPAQRAHKGAGLPGMTPSDGYSRKYWNNTYAAFFTDLDTALTECGLTVNDTIRVSEPRGLASEAWYEERWKVFYPIFLALTAKGYKRPELLR